MRRRGPAQVTSAAGSRFWRRAATSVLAHGALALVLTFPLVIHIAHALPGTSPGASFDVPLAIWAQAWGTHAITTAPARIAEANIFHPAPHALFYGVNGFATLPVFAPVFALTGNPTLAGNVTWLLYVVATAVAIDLVVQAWTGLASAGFVAGAAFLTTRWVTWGWIPSAPTYAAFECLPVIIWLLARPATGMGHAIGLGFLLALQTLTDLAYVAPGVLGTTAVLAAWRARRRETRRSACTLVAALAVAALALAPVALGYAVIRRTNPNMATQTVWPFPAKKVTHLPVDLVDPLSPIAMPMAAAVVLIAGLALRRRDPATPPAAWRHLALWTAVPLLLSLGPLIGVAGHEFRNPIDLLARYLLPPFAAVRVPERVRAPALVTLAMMCGLAFAAMVRASGLRRPSARAIFALVVLVGLWGTRLRGWPRDTRLPLDLTLRSPPAEPSAITRLLASEEGPVLELPAHTTDIIQHARAMYRSTFHWRPLLNGYDSFWPEGFVERMALATALPDLDALARLRRETGLATVVVPMDELSRRERAAWKHALAKPRDGLRLLLRDGGTWVVDVRHAHTDPGLAEGSAAPPT
jgi:hypothetical protein